MVLQVIIEETVINDDTTPFPAACRTEQKRIASAIVLAAVPELLFLYEKMPA